MTPITLALLQDLDRPDPAVRKRNKCLLSLVLGQEPDPSEKISRRWELAEELLDLDTGSWGDTHQIVHHCRGMFCCPGGIEQTRKRLWIVISATRQPMYCKMQAESFAYLTYPCMNSFKPFTAFHYLSLNLSKPSSL